MTTDMEENDVRDYGFDNLSITELRKIVADIAADSVRMSSEKKEYNAGVNAVLKENRKRMEAALTQIKVRQLDNMNNAIKVAGDKVLATGS